MERLSGERYGRHQDGIDISLDHHLLSRARC